MNRGPCVYILTTIVAVTLGLDGCMAGDEKKENEGRPMVAVL